MISWTSTRMISMKTSDATFGIRVEKLERYPL